MATTFLDLPADVWGKVASALPKTRAATLDRFSLALAHKDLYADLFRSDTGATWQQCKCLVGRGHEASVAAHARSVEHLFLDVIEADRLGPAAHMLRGMNKLRNITIRACDDATADAALIALLPIVAEHCASVDALFLVVTKYEERLVATCLPRLVARNRAVGALVHRLDGLRVRALPSATFLRGATLSRLAFAGKFPIDMPHFPSIVRVDVGEVLRRMDDPFADDAHAQRTARALPRLATLGLHWADSLVAPHLATFLRLVKPSLKRYECHNIIYHDRVAAAWPTGMDELALTDVWAQVETPWTNLPPGTMIKLDVGVLATQPLTRLVFSKSDVCVFDPVKLIATPSAWSFPALKHLDLRGCMPWIIGYGTLKETRGLPLPRVPAGALASLHTLLLGYTSVHVANVLFDVGQFSVWDAAPRLAILVVERARLVASCRAAAVAAKLAQYKPVLASVHLHECSVADDVMAAEAVEELVRGRERVCRCPRVGECLFGLDWWEAHVAQRPRTYFM